MLNKEIKKSKYLIYERKSVYALLMITAGMMGAYTFNLRGGVFCNAQTANILMMAIAFGERHWTNALYYLIPISAYLLGAFISEFIPDTMKKFGAVSWNTLLIATEIIILFIIGFIPLSVPNQIVQITINFICSMQYNTFRRSEGIPMATTFCTNHVRQVGVHLCAYIRNRNHDSVVRIGIHLLMLFSFVIGGAALTMLCGILAEKSIWIALIPLGIVLGGLIYADLTSPQEQNP